MKNKAEYTHNGSASKSFGLLLKSVGMSLLYALIWIAVIHFTK